VGDISKDCAPWSPPPGRYRSPSGRRFFSALPEPFSAEIFIFFPPHFSVLFEPKVVLIFHVSPGAEPEVPFW